MKKRKGIDSAWPEIPLVDGRALELLWEAADAWQELAGRLDEAERAAAHGTGIGDVNVVGGMTSRSSVESRLDDNGALADREVRKLRDTKDRWLRRMGTVVREMQVDLGHAEPEKGPRDNQGRLKILSS